MAVAIRKAKTKTLSRNTGGGTKRALPRVLCIIGPTSSGKTLLGIRLAKKFGGEIVNADARQVYREFDIGTGKPMGGKRTSKGGRSMYLFEGVPHYLMDYLPPSDLLTVAEWREKAMTAIRGIRARGHLPLVVGGTGLYIQALVDNYQIPAVPPQDSFRRAMEGKPLAELVKLLLRLDPAAEKLVDIKNPRRVLRALEVATFTGKPFTEQKGAARPVIKPLLIAIKREREELRERIDLAVEAYVEAGWIDEIRRLHRSGIGWDAPAMTSIGYREFGSYIRGESTIEQAIERTKRATWQYAKRQLTWFRRDTRINWVKDEEEAEKLVAKWLKARTK
ncbi:tRNA (adenosine(37)-N6)-dimethylallyltransferase MiaA [Candidatus Uhrbacteria bacterium]|nr:tRNA (adenosine(37)-N6)-dimethylallyltransferase MiaA [Candidatus Uhrbacteria bacterium]